VCRVPLFFFLFLFFLRHHTSRRCCHLLPVSDSVIPPSPVRASCQDQGNTWPTT
jgi:hypothetical protein